MSRRNHYEPAYGVVRLRWQRGEPPRSPLPVLCEVWRSSLSVESYMPGDRPRVNVNARIELRSWDSETSQWRVATYRGKSEPVEPGEVRRYATLPMRSWSSVVKLDGWEPDSADGAR